MMRLAVLAAALLHLTAAAEPVRPVDDPKSAARFIERCQTDPDFCTNRIQRTQQQLRAAREACVPAVLPPLEVGQKVVGVLAEVIEESPDEFKDSDYDILIRQLMVFLWPCDIVA